jgi:hypothetical protein
MTSMKKRVRMTDTVVVILEGGVGLLCRRCPPTPPLGGRRGTLIMWYFRGSDRTYDISLITSVVYIPADDYSEK